MEFEAGHQWEYDKTKLALDDLKEKIRAWLKSTYTDKDEAVDTFNSMARKVDKISKRQAHTISWSKSGDPDWHGKYYFYISKWIKLENELGVITSKMFAFETEGEDE